MTIQERLSLIRAAARARILPEAQAVIVRWADADPGYTKHPQPAGHHRGSRLVAALKRRRARGWPRAS